MCVHACVCVFRDAVVGALMPACMMPVECPSSSPVPPSDCSSVSSPSDAEGPPVTPDPEELTSPHPWQDGKRGEVGVASSTINFLISIIYYFHLNFQITKHKSECGVMVGTWVQWVACCHFGWIIVYMMAY